jgi:hypothetical protein
MERGQPADESPSRATLAYNRAGCQENCNERVRANGHLWHANLAARRALKREVSATLRGTPKYKVPASDIALSHLVVFR